MSPSIVWGVRNLILSAGLGGMRPNIVVLNFFNMKELRASSPTTSIPEPPTSPHPLSPVGKDDGDNDVPGRRKRIVSASKRRGNDTTTRLLAGSLPTDVIKREDLILITDYLTILEDLALRYRLNVAVAKGFNALDIPGDGVPNAPGKHYIDLWPIQMSAEVTAEGQSVLTTNFDTYTLILQLGYILQTVQTWKMSYRLRVFVFVEYEIDVEEERSRVKTLLEKLRIDADVFVLWLACGALSTYETIIHGRSAQDPDAEDFVDECLENEEWWQELKEIRGLRGQLQRRDDSLPSIARVLEAAFHDTGAQGRFPANDENTDLSRKVRRRRSSLAHQLIEEPGKQKKRRSSVSKLSRLGVNMGIGSQILPSRVLKFSSDSSHSSSSSSEGDSSDGMSDDESINGGDDCSAARGQSRVLNRRLMTTGQQNKTLGDPMLENKLGMPQQNSATRRRSRDRTQPVAFGRSYGTMPTNRAEGPAGSRRGDDSSTSPDLVSPGSNVVQKIAVSGASRSAPILADIHSPATPTSAEWFSGSAKPRTRDRSSGASRLERLGQAQTSDAAISPGSSASETRRVINEARRPRISVTSQDEQYSDQGQQQQGPKNQTLSSQTSYARFSSKPIPKMKVVDGEGGAGPKVSFALDDDADEATDHHPRRKKENSGDSNASSTLLSPDSVRAGTGTSTPSTSSRGQTQSATPSIRDGRIDEEAGGDMQPNIPDLLSSYHFGGGGGGSDQGSNGGEAEPLLDKTGAFSDGRNQSTPEPGRGSSYSTQALPLSFNDLPRRAQHLILNELMRQRSDSTAVLFTTLPIHEEVTCLSARASMTYLSDIEVLCNELPPVLMVLSNNMTVTVSL